MNAAAAVASAVANLGGRKYTRHDAIADLLAYADITSADGTRRLGPGMRPGHLRRRLARMLALEIRGCP